MQRHCYMLRGGIYMWACVDNKEDKADVDDDPNEKDMEYVNLDNGRERQWRMVFEDNDGGVDYAKALLHAKRWDIYVGLC